MGPAEPACTLAGQGGLDLLCVTNNQNLKLSKNFKKPSSNAYTWECQNFKFRST